MTRGLGTLWMVTVMVRPSPGSGRHPLRHANSDRPSTPRLAKFAFHPTAIAPTGRRSSTKRPSRTAPENWLKEFNRAAERRRPVAPGLSLGCQENDGEQGHSATVWQEARSLNCWRWIVERSNTMAVARRTSSFGLIWVLERQGGDAESRVAMERQQELVKPHVRLLGCTVDSRS